MNDLKCECCNSTQGIETMTLCNSCFHKIYQVSIQLMAENLILKSIIQDLKQKEKARFENGN